ncbi:MAG: hypothetical protein QXG86_01530 [Candidatus Woesearchaeota archaeon]
MKNVKIKKMRKKYFLLSLMLVIVFIFLVIRSSFVGAQENISGSSVRILKGDKWRAVVGAKTHEIKVIDVTQNGDMCGVSVDGSIQWIYVGDSKVINGVYIKVFNAYPVHSYLQDIDTCELFIGGAVSRIIPFVQEEEQAPIETSEIKKQEVKKINTDLKNISEIPEKKLRDCKGCFYEGVCYDYGYEMNNSYCSVFGSFEKKKQYAEYCVYDYECLNLKCIKNRCSVDTMWNKIARFLKKIFLFG